MPFKSEKQKKFLFANKPDIAKKWAEKYKDGGITIKKSNPIAKDLRTSKYKPRIVGSKKNYNRKQSR